MDTRPLRIFLLGTTLAVGAVVGLAPASDAKPIGIDIDTPIVVAPPTTVKPPIGIDPCDLVDCNDIPEIEVLDCDQTPWLCDPPTTTPPTTEPPTRRPPLEERPPKKSDNPDVVTHRPTFTG